MENLVLALLLASSVYGAYGIYCFQCNSYMDPECATIKPNDTSSRFYQLCEPTEASQGKEMFCRKTVQTIMDRENIQRVIRSCGWVIHPKQDCYWIWNKGHEDISCQCFSDACNSAAVNTPWISLFIGIPITLYCLFKG
ncbi:uncharacterized protein [Halyomorpha halys]|uniref:uncharacterized protein n=1 Tax=Halyomorpha halys TaxID=286706 RepID=UPI0006D50B80|nr:uncharacterized protein LOC106685072 [Halyomorpha halys]